MKFSKVWFCSTFLILFNGFFSVVPTHADEISGISKDLIQSRSYVGGFFSRMAINNDKDFDGNLAVQGSSPYELDLIPGINSNFGFGALLGHRQGDIALEVSYLLSQHTAYWAPGTPLSSTGSATYQSIDINLKRYLFTEELIQPFIQVGLALPWLNYPFASTDGLGNFSSLTISGFGINVGGGVELYFGDIFSVFGGVFHRWTTFDHAYGAQKVDWTIVVPLEGDAFDFDAGCTMKVW